MSNAGIATRSGDVIGPTSATDNAIARFDGTTGKLIQDSGPVIDDDGNIGIGVTPASSLNIGGARSVASWTTTGIFLALNSATLTDITGTGTITSRNIASFAIPTFAASNVQTITNAATVYIQGAPTAGANTTLTNPWSLWIDSGHVRADGSLIVGGGTSTIGSYQISSANSVALSSASMVYGALFEVTNTSTGGSTAFRGNCLVNNAGTTSSGIGCETVTRILGGGTITNSYLFRALSPVVSSGTIGTSYGLYIQKQQVTGVTTGWGVYQADSGDTNYFAGRFGIGTTGPDRALEINEASGNCLRLTYNDSNGSAANYADLSVSSAGVLTVSPSGVATVFSKPIRLKGYTVATLPAGTQGDTAFVTDSLAPAFLTTVVGGGAVVATVFYNGTNWVVQ